MAIQVEVVDLASGNSRTVALPEDTAMRDLLPVLVERLAIPTDSGRGLRTYKLTHKSPGPQFEYQDDDTLASRGTQEGDVLGLGVDFIAG